MTGLTTLWNVAVIADQLNKARLGRGIPGGLVRYGFVLDDGGRAAAGYPGQTGDCLSRAVCLATGRAYREVHDDLDAGPGNNPETGYDPETIWFGAWAGWPPRSTAGTCAIWAGPGTAWRSRRSPAGMSSAWSARPGISSMPPPSSTASSMTHGIPGATRSSASMHLGAHHERQARTSWPGELPAPD